MGRFLKCPLPLHSKKHQHNSDDHHQSQAYNNELKYLDSSNSSISSQPSLPSVPSLTPPHHHPTTPTADHHLIATLKGHSSYIFSLTLAGKHLYTGSSNGEIRQWDRNPSSSPNYNNTIAQCDSAVKSITSLGDKLFTAHHDHKIRVWKISECATNHQNHKLITTLPTVSDRFTSFFSPKDYVKVRRNKKCTWVNHVDAVSALALSTDRTSLYSVSWDRSLKVWRTSDFKCLESVQNAHDDAINAVVLSDNRHGYGYVYTGSADRKIKVWTRRDGDKKFSLVSTLEKHKSAVNALALSGDGSVLYSGACDRSIIVWEKDGGGAAHMVVAGALRGHTKAILCLGVVSDLLCSGSADKSVRIWKRGSGSSYNCLAVLEGHTSPVKCLTVSLDSSSSNCGKNGKESSSGNSFMVYSGGLDFDVKVWRIRVPF